MRHASTAGHGWKRPILLFSSLLVLGLLEFYFVKLEPVRQEIAGGPTALAREMVLARQDGIPVTLQQIRPPTPPESQNAAPYYEALHTLLRDKPFGKGVDQRIEASGLKTPADIDLARKTLHDRQDVLELIHRAADKPLCVSDHGWNTGVVYAQADLDFMAALREASRLLWTESFLLARDGHPAEAIANEGRVLHIAEHAASMPGILPNLVGLACEAIGIGSMGRLLNMSKPDAHTAELVQQLIREPRPHLSLAWALASETPISLGYMKAIPPSSQNAAGQDAAPAPAGGMAASPERRGVFRGFQQDWMDASQVKILQRLHRLIVAARKPDPKRLQLFKAEDQAITQETAGSSNSFLGSLTHSTSILSSISGSAESKTAIRYAQSEAQESSLLAGAAVLDYAARHGHFPDKLEDANSPVPMDPFNGSPLHYRQEPNGFVIYSLGESGTFGGGSPGMKRDSKEAYFRYEGG